MAVKEDLDVVRIFGEGAAQVVVHQVSDAEYGIPYLLTRTRHVSRRRKDSRDVPHPSIGEVIRQLSIAEKFIELHNKNPKLALKKYPAAQPPETSQLDRNSNGHSHLSNGGVSHE